MDLDDLRPFTRFHEALRDLLLAALDARQFKLCGLDGGEFAFGFFEFSGGDLLPDFEGVEVGAVAVPYVDHFFPSLMTLLMAWLAVGSECTFGLLRAGACSSQWHSQVRWRAQTPGIGTQQQPRAQGVTAAPFPCRCT